MKRLLVIGTILCSIILGIPAMLVLTFSSDDQPNTPAIQTAASIGATEPAEQGENVTVPVFRSQLNTIEEVALEEYVMGVVASEMPAEFEMEALKAQALTARTYIIKQLMKPGDIGIPDGAVVTDTVMHQVYKSKEELKEAWQKDFEWKYTRIQEAVMQTKGQVLTYDGQPITAAFFSTSNGYTENSEDYWQNPFPYLRSVESPWDETSPRYVAQLKMSVQEFQQKLGVQLPGDGSIGKIVNRTDGNRVATVNIGGKELTGREIREKLELNSTDFRWQRQGNEIVIQTKGWGHGVGMSQYGANGMAKEGRTYQDIVQHYYQGVSVAAVDSFIGQLVAKLEE